VGRRVRAVFAELPTAVQAEALPAGIRQHAMGMDAAEIRQHGLPAGRCCWASAGKDATPRFDIPGNG